MDREGDFVAANGLLAPERQVADLVRYQRPRADHRPVEGLLEPLLPPRGIQLQGQVGCADEPGLDPGPHLRFHQQ